MPFKAIIHAPANPEQMNEINKAIAEFRAEKTCKYLRALGINHDIICECLQQEKIHTASSKVS